MPLIAALREGFRRVSAAPSILAGVFAATVLLAVPLTLTLRAMIEADLGSSLAAERAAAGVNYDWWQEFTSRASGLGATLSPSVIGFAAVMKNQSDLLDNVSLPITIASAATAYVFVWLFLVGGVLDRFARNRPTHAAGFFAASGVYFFRFLRLAVIGWLAYYVLFAWIHGWLLDDLYSWLIHEVAAERVGFVIRLALYAIFGALLLACNLILDYAKIRAVVEDRRSMIGALVAGFRFVVRRPGRTIGLYLACGAIFAGLVLLYRIVAPGAGGAGLSMWIGLLVGQLFILGRLWTRLLFFASQIAWFQSELAHADYVAAPQPVWPESPSVEALETVR